MTIYSIAAGNKLKTYILVGGFILFYSFVFYLIGLSVQDSKTYFFIGFVLAVLSSIGSYFYSDKLVLFSTGAKPAKKKEYFDFYTVSENLSIASGLHMPKLYVIDDPSPNAFATGRDPKHAVICTTSGLLKKLDRVELEGVLAHELSHIRNYDILLSSIVAVLVGSLVFVVDWITRGWLWGVLDDDNRKLGPIFFIFLVLTLIIAPLVATLIQLAISRKREFLADATGALITRYPEGLADALEKISSDKTTLKRASGATAHLFIVNPFKNKRLTTRITTLFSTHPPIDKRVEILRSM